jgi:hypothetical protein
VSSFAGCGDHANVASTVGDDASAVGGELGARAGELAGLDRRPPHQGGALLICGYLDIKSAGDPRLTCFRSSYFSIFFDGRWVRLSSVSVSRLGQRPTAKRPQGLDIETERRMLPVSKEDLVDVVSADDHRRLR